MMNSEREEVVSSPTCTMVQTRQHDAEQEEDVEAPARSQSLAPASNEDGSQKSSRNSVIDDARDIVQLSFPILLARLLWVDVRTPFLSDISSCFISTVYRPLPDAYSISSSRQLPPCL